MFFVFILISLLKASAYPKNEIEENDYVTQMDAESSANHFNNGINEENCSSETGGKNKDVKVKKLVIEIIDCEICSTDKVDVEKLYHLNTRNVSFFSCNEKCFDDITILPNIKHASVFESSGITPEEIEKLANLTDIYNVRAQHLKWELVDLIFFIKKMIGIFQETNKIFYTKQQSDILINHLIIAYEKYRNAISELEITLLKYNKEAFFANLYDKLEKNIDNMNMLADEWNDLSIKFNAIVEETSK